MPIPAEQGICWKITVALLRCYALSLHVDDAGLFPGAQFINFYTPITFFCLCNRLITKYITIR